MPQAPVLSSSSSPLAILSKLESLGIRLGLEAIRRLLGELGDPQRRFPAVLVAGSNGKGSTAALLAAMARAAGYRTGLYTSPHLEAVEERLRIDGRVIETVALAELLEQAVRTSEEKLGSAPTYFEALTAAAFSWFASQGVELAVLEVGMGGRLDATNACEPELSLVTSISLEHREHLGDTLAAIAREKAGILRAGKPALTWIEEPEAVRAVADVAGSLGAAWSAADAEVEIAAIEPLGQGFDGQRVRLVTPHGRYALEPALLGDHQAKNLALAVRAAELLAERGFVRFDRAAIEAGAAACRWAGRLEPVSLPGGRMVLLDAAHNPGGAEVLAAFLERALSGAADLVFGVLDDKDAGAMLAKLVRPHHVRHAVLTTPSSPRARDPRELAALAPPLRGEVSIEPAPERALARALELGAETLVVCGSIYLVGEVRGLLRRRFGTPPAAALPEERPRRLPASVPHG